MEAARAAIAEGVSGSLSSGLHHARYDSGCGFCTFNGLAIAAKTLIAEGAAKVLVLDFDAHCGGGTHSMIVSETRIRQIDISVSSFDSYQASGENVLDLVDQAGDYLGVVQRRLEELGRSGWVPDLCLYNAGMDPMQTCPIGRLKGIDASILRDRETMVFEWLVTRGIPVAFVLAGGYVGGDLEQDELVALHRLTIESAVCS